jgi:DNA-binding CsgD family transcriptional regulator/type II secretory pathway pseudopilin PulG
MDRLLTTICCALFCAVPTWGDTKEGFRAIDEAIAHSSEYVARYERKITEARKALEVETSPEEVYSRCYDLYQLYRPFVSDSAMFFLQRCIQLADGQGKHADAVRCRSLLAIRCSSIGMYDEALNILDSIQPHGVDSISLGTYYEAYNNVYSELHYYTRLQEMKALYLQKAQHYEQMMLQYLPPTDEACFLRREQRAQNEGDLKKSMAINDEWLGTVEKGSHPYALVALYRYIEYKMQGDSVQMMHWLKESVLADIHNAVMDQGSMWELANELMLKGDIDRASRYISFTSDCANRYGSRQRNWQIAPLLTHIAKEYKGQSERTTRQLRITIALISILALLLLGLLFFLHRRNKQLSAARNALRGSNKELASANRQLAMANSQLATQTDELTELNTQLSEKNAQFLLLNSQLAESNHVKEEYIGRFLSLCSQYIDKLDSYRKMVNKKMKNKELDELFQLSKSTELKERELDELYENFDSVFLHLFPNFIDDFNALLMPEAQVHPKQENRLTTEMRIFALIRLGIEDSSKIAEFLHYSVNTIYNYRARIKNGAIVNREQFESRVKELGLPSGNHAKPDM